MTLISKDGLPYSHYSPLLLTTITTQNYGRLCVLQYAPGLYEIGRKTAVSHILMPRSFRSLTSVIRYVNALDCYVTMRQEGRQQFFEWPAVGTPEFREAVLSCDPAYSLETPTLSVYDVRPIRNR